ncbi:MAG: DMT family transporter [Lachnospiraceae bacterium]|nr:DMT family transporter [Lachnospiraceae bacterium]
MFVSSMLIFGTIGVFRRYIPFSSAFLAFSRGILGGIFLLIFASLRKGTKERLANRDLLWLVLSGALIGINWMLLFEAYNYTTVAIATLCYYMQPTIVVLLSPIIFKERLTGKKAICAFFAIIGMVLVSGVINDGSQNRGSFQGVLLGLGAAVFYSIVVIMNKRIAGVDAYQKTRIQLLSAGIVMIPYLLLTDGFRMGEVSVRAIILLILVGIVHTGIAYVLYFGSMEGLSVQTIAILSYIDPVSALLFSALLLRETLSLMSIIGAVMIIGSAIISEMKADFS